MPEKSNIYTRTGDAGTTSLVDGSRVRKDNVRLEAYGTLDEFSSFLGVVLSAPDCPPESHRQLLTIQNRLFDIGAYLATPSNGTETPAVRNLDKEIEDIEHWIDAIDAEVPKLRAFILPGGSQLSAHAHVARTVCRRAERRILSLAAQEYVDPTLIKYVNRLSDYLFILARYLNHKAGIAEITWQPA